MLILGLAGFIPGLTSHAMLLEIFKVNPATNAFHLFAGAARDLVRLFECMANNLANARLHLSFALTFLAIGLVRTRESPLPDIL